MRKSLYSILIIYFFSLTSIEAATPDQFLFNAPDETQIVVNNRILAFINGKPISALDVMKKMDMLFLKQFPEYTTIPQARFQFYQVNWRRILQELIDKELILADAQERAIQISMGDVRQEMESLFGPNIISNLDKIGLTFDEAFKIVQGDITLRRMMMARVNSKAIRGVTPQAIRTAYEEFAQKNLKQETFHYQVITIRNSDSTLGAEIAKATHDLLTEEKIPLDQILTKLKEKFSSSKNSATISDPFYHAEKDINELIISGLQNLEPGSFSQPIAQKSRTDRGIVFRILYLIDKVPAGAVPYTEIENQLKDELYDSAIAAESEAYLKKLHRHYAISDDYIKETIPADFQPFSLR